ncbi:hypothetical protein CRU79_00650 [Escherichia sp. E4385]|nr:hypothetical protein CRI66_10915 [Escherichia sp. E4694]TGC19706.1 hypothetical protein CRU79_00650 [Escherichia sp. E4385]
MVLGASIFPAFHAALCEGSIRPICAVVCCLFVVYRAAFREISIGYRRYMASFGAIRKLLVQMPPDQ